MFYKLITRESNPWVMRGDRSVLSSMVRTIRKSNMLKSYWEIDREKKSMNTVISGMNEISKNGFHTIYQRWGVANPK